MQVIKQGEPDSEASVFSLILLPCLLHGQGESRHKYSVSSLDIHDVGGGCFTHMYLTMFLNTLAHDAGVNVLQVQMHYCKNRLTITND